LDHLDNLKALDRHVDWPVRVPVIDKYRDGGKTWVSGKVETGSVTKGQQLIIVPGKV
jgi:peptide chain release factor subunit 3